MIILWLLFLRAEDDTERFCAKYASFSFVGGQPRDQTLASYNKVLVCNGIYRIYSSVCTIDVKRKQAPSLPPRRVNHLSPARSRTSYVLKEKVVAIGSNAVHLSRCVLLLNKMKILFERLEVQPFKTPGKRGGAQTPLTTVPGAAMPPKKISHIQQHGTVTVIKRAEVQGRSAACLRDIRWRRRDIYGHTLGMNCGKIFLLDTVCLVRGN